MIGRINIRYPIIKKLGIAYYKVFRSVGFDFDNQAIWILCHNNDLDLSEFDEKFGDRQDLFFSEFLYAAYCSNRIRLNKKRKFSKVQILKGFSELSEEERKSIIKTWEASEKFGVKDIQKKKAGNL